MKNNCNLVYSYPNFSEETEGEHYTTWEELIKQEMAEQNESFDDVVKCTLTSEELKTRFDFENRLPNGKSFILWTKKRVYFPTEFEVVESVPRDPCDECPRHI